MGKNTKINPTSSPMTRSACSQVTQTTCVFISDSGNIFISASTNMFTSDLANMFTSELKKSEKMIWPTCSLVKLTGEYVGLAPGIRHLIRFSFCLSI